MRYALLAIIFICGSCSRKSAAPETLKEETSESKLVGIMSGSKVSEFDMRHQGFMRDEQELATKWFEEINRQNKAKPMTIADGLAAARTAPPLPGKTTIILRPDLRIPFATVEKSLGAADSQRKYTVGDYDKPEPERKKIDLHTYGEFEVGVDNSEIVEIRLIIIGKPASEILAPN